MQTEQHSALFIGARRQRRKSRKAYAFGATPQPKKPVSPKGRAGFTFTVIEYFGMRFDDGKILQREAYWKKVFDTVRHGYNDN